MTPDFIHDLGEKLRCLQAIRLRAGFTQQRIADLLGIHRSRVSMWERGKALPRGAMLILLARLIDYMQLKGQNGRAS